MDEVQQREAKRKERVGLMGKNIIFSVTWHRRYYDLENEQASFCTSFTPLIGSKKVRYDNKGGRKLSNKGHCKAFVETSDRVRRKG